jgi:hypothetical protein
MPRQSRIDASPPRLERTAGRYDFMRFSFYFWSFAEIADIYFLWFIKFFSLDLLMLNTSQFSG